MKFINKVKVKHSPGPWKAIRNSCFYDIKTAQDDYCQSIAGTQQNEYIGVDEDVEKANANLIAAAPGMYEALEAVIGYLELSGMGQGILNIVKDALKKANGEE